LKNLLTDIAGVRVGHAHDAAVASGVTAIVFDAPAVASIDVRGGGPGTRDPSVLELEGTVEEMMYTIHAHPTLSESLLDAYGAVQGMAINA